VRPAPAGYTRLLPYASLALAIVSLGFSAIFVRLADAPGLVTGFYRMAVAVVLMAWPFIRRWKRTAGLPRAGLWLAVLGGVLFAGDLGFWATGVVMSGAVNPTLLGNTAPVWVGLGAFLLFKEHLTARFWAGLVLAMSGAVLVLGIDALRATALGVGSLLGLTAAVFYGGYFLVAQRGRRTLDALSYVWLSTASAAAVLLTVTIALGLPLTGYDAATYLNFLGLGAISQVLGYLAINHALGHLPASLVAPTMLGQPVVTALLAGPLLGETMVAGQVLGGLTVLAGVYVVHRSQPGTPDHK
jgi:drug/metabolite transporter (DMT)-like permease